MGGYQEKKPARTADDLLFKLKERKLIVKEEEEIFIKEKIRTLGYYRLSGYFGPLQTDKDVFRPGSSFQDILRLYEFDRELRIMTSKALKSIEITVKARITDVMSLVYNSDWYVRDELFMTEKRRLETQVKYVCKNGVLSQEPVLVEVPLYESLMGEISKHVARNGEMEFIRKFYAEYGESAIVPSWMMMECISFGPLSRLYNLLKNCQEKKMICFAFGASSPDIFSSWLHGFVVLRNACAHHARIWNKKLLKDVSFPTRPSYKFVTGVPEDPFYLRKFYGISSCILKILSKISLEQSNTYKTELYDLIKKYGIDKQAMGFPAQMEPHDIWLPN